MAVFSQNDVPGNSDLSLAEVEIYGKSIKASRFTFKVNTKHMCSYYPPVIAFVTSVSKKSNNYKGPHESPYVQYKSVVKMPLGH